MDSSSFPHVTDVIALVRNMQWTPEYALERGRMVHKACALMDGWEGSLGLDFDSLHPVLVPYVEAYQLFLKAFKPDYIAIEANVKHMEYRYQGRLDRATETEVLDFKCGGDRHAATGLQLAGYERAFGKRRRHRLAVHLLPTGRFFIVEYRDRADFPLFLGLLNIHQWRLKYGLYRESR